MDDKSKGLIIGYVNRGACRAMGVPKGVRLPMRLTDAVLDYLAERYPDEYMGKIKFLTKAAANQIAFARDGDETVLFCMFGKADGGLRGVTFHVKDDGTVLGTATIDDLMTLGGEWEFVKASARKDYGKR